MFEFNQTAIRCDNHTCPRRGEPFAFVTLHAGDGAQVVCPSCGWVTTMRVADDGTIAYERRSGASASSSRRSR